MATTIVSSNDTSAGKLWAEKFFRKAGFDTFIDKLMGTGDNSIIKTVRDLERKDGDRVRFHIINELGGEFILGSSGTSLEGQENALSWAYQDVILEEYKLGVRVKNGLDIKRSIFPISEIAEERLRLQVSKNLDKLWFKRMLGLDGNSAPSKILYAGDASSVATLDAADTVTHALCSKLKYGAMSGWQTGTANADGMAPVVREPLKPVRFEGGEYLVLVVHPYAVYNLVQDPAYQTMVREAMERGRSNPLFSGAVAVLDNVIIKTSNHIPFYNNGGGAGNIPFCRGLLLGQGASVWAWGKQLEVVNKAFGYEEEEGWGAKLIFKTERTAWTPQGGSATDYGCAEVVCACTDLGA